MSTDYTDREFVKRVAEWRKKTNEEAKLRKAIERFRLNPITANLHSMFDLINQEEQE